MSKGDRYSMADPTDRRAAWTLLISGMVIAVVLAAAVIVGVILTAAWLVTSLPWFVSGPVVIGTLLTPLGWALLRFQRRDLWDTHPPWELKADCE